MPDDTKHGTIESLVTDQGNGASYCSVCLRFIDIRRVDRLPYPCPECGAELYFGSVYSGGGGSD